MRPGRGLSGRILLQPSLFGWLSLSFVPSTLGQAQDPGETVRLVDDQASMLRSLRYLYSLYKEEEKLQEVERRLKEAGGGN